MFSIKLGSVRQREGVSVPGSVMAPAGRMFEFFREGNDWFCDAGLPCDLTIIVQGTTFHMHKFPLISKCGKVAKTIEESQSAPDGSFTMTLEGFPCGPDTFLLAAKFCYGVRVKFTARNIVMVYCAAGYLEMTDEYGEDNLLSRSEMFFHKNVLGNWKECIMALQSSEPVIKTADKLQIITKCLNSVSIMACTDPSLFGWPMMMYGRVQSPGGSILWNGINTGARIRSSSSSEPDWWFEDISYLGVCVFERLIQTMEGRGIRPQKLVGAIMYYANKYLPGLGRWLGRQITNIRTVASSNLRPAVVDQRELLESIVKLLPEKKGKSFCRFLLGLLRVTLILGVNGLCQDSLERKIGAQLDFANLDSLLIPSYSDSDTLYNTDCVERMIHHFTSSEQIPTLSSPLSSDVENSLSSEPLKKVAKLIDSYMAEVASDVNLKPGQIHALAEAFPESSRSLNDGLYRAIDVYLKAHPWLPENEKERLCNIIDFHKLSIDACAHASQNERLPLRVILQVLFFEQLQLRVALAGCLQDLDPESTALASTNIPTDIPDQIVQRDGLVSVMRGNRVLKMDMETMKSRVGEIEEELSTIKQEIRKVTKSHSSLGSLRFLRRRMGCKFIPRSSDAQDNFESTAPTPRAAVEQAGTSHYSRPRKVYMDAVLV